MKDRNKILAGLFFDYSKTIFGAALVGLVFKKNINIDYASNLFITSGVAVFIFVGIGIYFLLK